ncbi:MAG TPA: alpha-(1-_3)-arabinofuranosyltransferase family protein [Streptosporangiaceae bacterium]
MSRGGLLRIRPAFVLVWLLALIVLVATDTGRIFFDTKLGVDLDPVGFYLRLWHLWNPLEWFGTLQDQYIGYAFPMAPFYLAGQLLKVPVWLTERLWLSLLIVAGYAGLVKLAEALRIGTPRSRAVAGLAFVLWPTFTIVIGSTSAGLLPGLLVPWAVLPLAGAASGRPIVRAAAQSGLAVLFMGGVNAASTLYVLILPALFIVTQLRGGRRVRLGASWTGAVALATSWWVVPLLLQAKYSFNFLPYVEQSATTTGTMSAAAFLRGAGDWTAYLNLGQPWLPAGWAMVANPLSVIAAALTAGTGLLGLARRDVPASGWLRISLGIAALIALAGYPGPLGGLFHQPVDQLLNGVLAPLRSVYKVEPVAAVVLALGIAHALVLRTRRPALTSDPAPRALWHLLAAPVIGLVVIGLAYPQLSGQVLNAGSFRAVPGYWYRVASFLRQHSPNAPALVVPAEAHGTFLWGETVDDPLEPLASSPWVADGLVPYGGAGSQLLLSALEAAVTSGEQVRGLAATLRRSGIGYVVVRNDLSPSVIGYTPPRVVHQTLVSSGFRRIASFGPLITGAQTSPGAGQVRYALPSYRAVEVFVPSGPSAAVMPSPVVALPVSRTVLVNGGPEAMLQLSDQHLLTALDPAVIAGDKLAVPPARWAITDTLRRADHAFGLVGAPASYTYTATEVNPPDDPLGDAGGAPRQMLPVSPAGHQTVAVLSGAAAVTASSSGSWFAQTPQIDPVNAFDGNPSTVWTEATPSTPAGQWIQITFAHRVALPGSVAVMLLDDTSARPVPSRLMVTTDTGTVTSAVRRTGRAQPLRVPPGLTRTLRITIVAVSGGVPGGPGAGFADVSIPGVTVTRYLKPPQSPAGLQAAVTEFSFQRQVPSPASLADVVAYPPLARMFTVSRQQPFRLTATAMGIPGAGLDMVLSTLAPARKDTLEVSASSTWGSLPGLAAARLFSQQHPSPWIAGARKPVIRLSWQGSRTISSLVVQPLPGFAAAPEAIKITSPHGDRFAEIGLGGLTEIVPPLRTDRMTISFPVVQYATTSQPVTGAAVQLPVGLSKLTIPALADLRPASPAPGARFTLPCGKGPHLMLDGHILSTSVTGKVSDLTGFQPVQVSVCQPGSAVPLTRGRHWLTAARPGTFTITDVSLTSVQPGAARTGQGGAVSAPAAGPGRPVRVLAWTQEFRRVRIGSGAESYLEVHQNANPGWTATMSGRALIPVRLDGWQQGFLVPAGAGGTITLTFSPVKFYHVWIILSAIAVLALCAVAMAGRWRRKEPGQVEREQDAPAAPEAPGGAHARHAAAPGLGLLILTLLIAVTGGPVAIAVPLLAVAAYLWPGWYGGIACVAMAAAGILTALAAHPAATGSGAFGAPAQACALVALIVALTPALPSRRAGR